MRPRSDIVSRLPARVTLAACFLVLVAGLATFVPACGSDAGPAVAPADAVDGNADAAGVADVLHDTFQPDDTGTGPDHVGVPDTPSDTPIDTPRDVPGDGSDGVVPDVGGADGGPPGALPEWAQVESGSGPPRLVARLAERAVHLTPLADGTLRVTCTPPGADPPTRSWAVDPAPTADPEAVFGGREDVAQVATATWSARIEADGRVAVRDAAGRTLVEDATPCVVGAAGASVHRATPADEAFYGFGEKTGPLDKRGRRMTFWNTDPYDPTWGGYAPEADPIYQSIPFFVGLRGDVAYGLFTDDPRRLVMDMAATDAGAWSIDTPGASIDQYVVLGPRMQDVLRRYTALTGRSPLPPKWALGLHQSRWGYTAEQALSVAERYRAEAIPADVLWLDIQHMREFRTFTWDPAQYPDPGSFVAALDALHFHLVVIADPCLKTDSGWDVYADALADDHLLRRPNGDVYVGTAWPGECAFPDFTAARTRDWWADLVGRPLSHGVHGIWLDVNEPTTFDQPSVSNDVPVDGDGHVDGDGQPATMAEAHNVYALNEARATWDGFRRALPDRRPFILSRAGYAGIQRYAAVWTGDVPSTWHGLAESLPMMLNLGLSGVPFVGSDVGGYAGGASPELFARWMALGAVSPFFRIHTTRDAPDQEPWQFEVEVRDISRAVTEWRYSLLPYLYSLAAEATVTGAPPLRPLVWDFPGDTGGRARGDLALLGPWLLVAPVLEEEATTRSVHLPPGRWFEYASGAARDGGDFETGVRLAALPVWVREGAILPWREPQQWVDGGAADPLFLDVYPGAEPSSFVLYEDAGDTLAYQEESAWLRTRYALARTPEGAVLEASREGTWRPPARSLVVRIRRVDAAPTAVTLDDAELTARAGRDDLLAAAEGWWWDERDLSLQVAFPDRDAFTLAAAYDPQLADLRPDVDVHIVVSLPEGTPRDTAVHVATSANGWTQQPLAWGPGADEAHGTITVPRGEWYEFKYTRGSWESVEKWPGCEEASNRYAFGAAWPERHDVVFAWRDICEGR